MIGMEGNRRRQARAPKVQRALEATLKTLEAQLVDRGRPNKVAIVACMRRLLGILNAIIRTASPWQTA
jgi:transposase